jgi:lipopolysaccharide transport system ATP-binding protein
MYVRLAFAVAAHLEPEILIVDEVLAVGDAQFQKKCLGKMEEVSKGEGRTILFVSHNMHAISALCSKAILMNKGQIAEYGDAIKVLNTYFLGSYGKGSVRKWEADKRPGNDEVKLNHIRVIESSGKQKDTFNINEKIGIEMCYEVLKDNNILWQGHNVYNAEGINIFDTHSVNSKYYKTPHAKGTYTAIVWIPENLLPEGTFIVSSAVFNHAEYKIYFHEKDAVIFNVIETYDGQTARGLSTDHFPGIVRPLLDWDISKLN